ncbi:glycosyltransferase [Janibacter hoylei PVAS-1]|uniref:Glycosyl transferase n=1 Tax=Janibacter hoylei PVAS-1 TaxID=1210046 RepID=K1E946_9MICO|nr:glycosyltransferase [Janibacter hoylei]EKA61952.1 glycosyltransferase [Janibacter hoylei PVAS-1]RWU84475.1 glycosyl transferase [Janibacter hoylei PVAS-1]
MRILHVVSLVDPDGAFGGPLRVAMNQANALRAAGHDVVVAAGARGWEGELPTHFGDDPVTLFPAHQALPGTGFAGLVSPGLLAWLRRWAPTADVVHLHLARDLVTLPAGRLLKALGLPYVAQTHGMIDASDSPLVPPLDAGLTRPVLRGARAVFALTELERSDLEEVVPGLGGITVLHNGVPETSLRADPVGAREVLFLARVAPRKRPAVFVAAAQIAAREHPDVTFTVCGPDEGEGDALRAALATDDADGRITYEGAVAPEATLERMTRAAAYVLPAVEEPYGMTVVEAMSVGLPTVVMSDCGLAGAVAETGGEVVTGLEAQPLADAMSRLLADPQRRATAGAAGVAWVREHVTMESVVERLLDAYRAASR